MLGIVNGTTNYILTRMGEEGAEFADVLADAQALGYAEADPTADVEGHDAAQKAAIIAGLSFHTSVTAADVYCEGITGITKADVEAAADMGFVIKLLAIAEELRRRGLRAGAPHDGSAHPPAGLGPRGLQRGVRDRGVGRAR